MAGHTKPDNIVEKGTISVQMENIFPIIKKWLYSEKDIFLRELITNSLDAISKLKQLAVLGEFKAPEKEEEFSINVAIDKEKGTLTVSDNGIGMTADEVKKYINEVAFSSAQDFLEKYKTADEKNMIIGHFGLGFYSSFMVADLVEIQTLSWQEGAEPVKWSCNGSPEYELSEGSMNRRGTEVTLIVSADEKEFLDEVRVKNVIQKYCGFLPVPVRLNGSPVNERKPLWLEKPGDLKDEDYRDFFRYLYPFEQDPIFWIHLNVEYPVRAKGILYFPTLKHDLDPSRGRIKFYYNQVYVSDNLKDLIPEFLMNLRGVIDCPDMPLNVSRSYLQSDPTMRKLSTHITKKVADELNDLYRDRRETYEKYWDDISPFIKIGMMDNEKFYDAVKEILIYKSTQGGYTTLKEYMERAGESSGGKIYYATDETLQSSYLSLFKEQSIEVLMMSSLIDTHFIQFLEFRDPHLKFARVDSDISDRIKDSDGASKIVDPKTNKTHNEIVEDIFRKNLDIKGLTIKVENLRSEEVPAMIIISEQQRRMREMTAMLQRKPLESLEEHTLVVNANNAIVKNLRKMLDMLSPPLDEIKLLSMQIYDLALLTQKTMPLERADRFVENSLELLRIMTEARVGQ
ncbi:MAG: molecular chaperone HtpG [Candidatus Eremiobacteraeota bacterium]|nr:molecular chaperone HtpG [Candidatus Eremiobacteraeota bacterium]